MLTPSVDEDSVTAIARVQQRPQHGNHNHQPPHQPWRTHGSHGERKARPWRGQRRVILGVGSGQYGKRCGLLDLRGRVLFEDRHITATRHDDADGLVHAFLVEVPIEPLAQSAALRAHNAIDGGVVVARPPEDLFPYLLLIQLVRMTVQRLLTDVIQEA
ncbi:MAG: hypothetical protein JWP44_4592 [Mucilaginibacter sp.]|nr:hypothetical protein [Mucilaginibacter sp.]